MLEFLSSPGFSQGLGALSSIGGLISGIKGERDVNKAYQNQGPTASERQSNSLLQALIDPNNSLVKSLQQEDTMKSVQEFLTRIRGMQMADRRIQGRGGQPTFFDPERADDSVNFLTSRALPGLSAAGLDSARNRISAAQRGFAGNVDIERDRQKSALENMKTHTQYRTDMINGLPQIFQQIQGMFGQQDPWEDPEGQSDYQFGGYRL